MSEKDIGHEHTGGMAEFKALLREPPLLISISVVFLLFAVFIIYPFVKILQAVLSGSGSPSYDGAVCRDGPCLYHAFRQARIYHLEPPSSEGRPVRPIRPVGGADCCILPSGLYHDFRGA